eukprot:CAMPEP_0181296680 /NCGR_PEP_ID=MMETSP1101-20121128/4834_1 /TAXON_ID=46948 /ORGANISM="Rhodomonas abbreviata, Strain Caron Lab Isolate" /LENGTH=224 /DNA_ID=CAMNT_0023401563 /DNA_START=91 /DNA_END=765 /DNA_ORIENTATION=-
MAEWGESLLGWGSVLVVLVAMGLNVSFFLGASWVEGVALYLGGWLTALSIPIEVIPNVILIVVVVACVFYNLGWYICFFDESPEDVANEQPGFIGKHYLGKPNEKIQMVICIRQDLGMGAGKVALQCGHGTVGIYRRLWQKNVGLIKCWEGTGQAKVLLKLDSEPALLSVQGRAKAKGLPTYVVRDKAAEFVDDGLKQGNRTTLVLLGPPSILQDVVGDLPLLE